MHLTKRTIEALTAGEHLVWYPDAGKKAVPGLHLLVTPAGSKTFVCRYRLHGSRRRRTISLGTFPGVTLVQAREKAKKINAQALHDEDPLAIRQAQRALPTFSEWVDTYLADAEKRKRPISIREDRRYTAIAVERWGTRSVDAISSDDVRTLHRKIGKTTPVQADRFLACIRKLFADALDAGKVPINPAAGVKHLVRQYRPRQRVLSGDETSALAGALAKEDAITRAGILLMLGAGLRSSEARKIRWADVDEETHILMLPETKSGTVQAVPLSPEMVELIGLARIERDAEEKRERECRSKRGLPQRLPSPYLFPGRDPMKPRADWKRIWIRVMESAKLDKAGITRHDLRRTAGYVATKTAGIAVAKALLRHSNIALTASTYAPLIAEDARPAVEALGRLISFAEARQRTA